MDSAARRVLFDGASPQSRLYPPGEREARLFRCDLARGISTHAPKRANFNPRSPWGERRTPRPLCSAGFSDFNPRSPWGERLFMMANHSLCFSISIHAPRGGSDWIIAGSFINIFNFNPRSPWGERRRQKAWKSRKERISIHAPRGGSDVILSSISLIDLLFQSTLPVGGATSDVPAALAGFIRFQSTLPVGGATPTEAERANRPFVFQSTLPVGGATRRQDAVEGSVQVFQSTLPVGGATARILACLFLDWYFNPRSPWGERRRPPPGLLAGKDFNPRSPWGERLCSLSSPNTHWLFQSTLPVGGATSQATQSADR